jgi:hypothetical protein
MKCFHTQCMIRRINSSRIMPINMKSCSLSNTGSDLEFVKEMIAFVKSLDPTRPLGFASNRLGSQPWFDAIAVSDFVLMNQYFGT